MPRPPHTGVNHATARRLRVHHNQSAQTVLYTGVTNNLKRRIWEHKEKLIEGFTQKYRVNKLVYYEVADDILGAIAREKQIKGGSRQKKIDLIDQMNPEWRDLYDEL
jgi:putative endonuclease